MLVSKEFYEQNILPKRQVYRVWSIDGSLWQAIKFLAPLTGIVAMLAHAAGLWPR